jgi:capsular polysaccharide biosynthesis protein
MYPYLLILLRWFLLAVVIFAVTVPGGIYLVDRLLPTVYLAKTILQVNLQGNPPGQPAEFQPEFETIQSPLVLNAVIARLDLKTSWSKRIFRTAPGLISDQRALTYLTSLLKVGYKRGSNIINISVTSDDPQEANAVAAEYEARREQMNASAPNHPVIVILSPALPGTVPIRPNRDLSLAVVIVVGCALSFIVPTLVELGLWLSRASRIKQDLAA